jgi:phosphatidylinositol alpha-1,6-mannosyltransferase
MERLMQHLARGMAEYADLTVIGPDGCTHHLPEYTKVYEVSEKLAPFVLISTLLAIRACRGKSFDIVIGGSGLIAPTLSILSWLFKCKTAIYLHGLDIVVANFWYQRIFVPRMRSMDLILVNSRSTRQLAIDKGVREQRIEVVNPGTEIPEMPSADTLAEFRSRYRIPFDKIIVFVGRMTQRKGLSVFIAKCLPAILTREPKAGLVIVGKNPEQSLNRLGEENDVLSAVESSQYKDRIVFLGQLDDMELRACYAASDVQILPLKHVKGDIEGFGMVAIEAAALGTPTVAFSMGGVADAINNCNGRLVPAGRYDEFAKAVLEILSGPVIDGKSCRRHAANFSWEIVNASFRDALTGQLQR